MFLPIRRAMLVAALLLLMPAMGCLRGTDRPPPGTPKLLLFIVVDQLATEYLERYRPLLGHGIVRLLDESIAFEAAHHAHANTWTATGHATLATGMHPRHHGIIANRWFDRTSGDEVSSVGGATHERSPEHLLSPTIGDLLRRRYDGAKSYAVGGKDRASIFMAGRGANAAYWFESETGRFETSGYYRAGSPGWLDELHDLGVIDRYFGETWRPLLPMRAVGEYGVVAVDRGLFERRFPHPIGGASLYPGAPFYESFERTPYMDDAVVELAKALIDGEGLGEDATPDFLGVTLPALDAAGHDFGPESPEYVDALMRVDRAIETLLEFVDDRIGLERTIVVLSADHGVAPIPEFAAEKDHAFSRRFDDAEIACFQRAGTRLNERFGDFRWLRYGIYLDRALVRRTGVDRRELADAIKRSLEKCGGVRRAHIGSDLEERGVLGRLGRMEQLFFNAHHSERSPDVLIQLAANTLMTNAVVASHGSVYRYDREVPLLLRIPGASPAGIEERVATADVVPTLAGLLGLGDGIEFDGVDRSASIVVSAPEA